MNKNGGNGNGLQIEGLRTWIEIDKKAVANNLSKFRSLMGKKTKIMAVIKSNAYGHGLHGFASEIVECGADFIGVDSITEALALRKIGIGLPILVLGYTLPEMFSFAVKEDINLTVSNIDVLKKISTAHKKVKIHLKIDSGMHRQGFVPSEMKDVLKILSKSRGSIFVEGIYTHFASAKNPSFPQYTRRQMEIFNQWTKALFAAGSKPLRHSAATAGAVLFPESHLDMVRIGIGLYGLWPSKEVESFASDRILLKPVLTWKAVVGEVKKVIKGEGIGYDLTEILQRDSLIAIIPIGYWHGFPRTLSSIGHVLIKGKRARVIGRVAMDMIVVDVTDISGVEAGNEVVLLGKQGKDEIKAVEIAQLCDTVHYEIVTRLNPLIKRLYV